MPKPPAERHAGDPGVAYDASRRGEAELLRGTVKLAPEDAAGSAHSARRPVDSNRLHKREVDHKPAVT
jgi:hypothetical protein